MRHFTKNILCKQFALISPKTNFFNISVKGFANNFKNNNPLSSDSGSYSNQETDINGNNSIKESLHEKIANLENTQKYLQEKITLLEQERDKFKEELSRSRSASSTNIRTSSKKTESFSDDDMGAEVESETPQKPMNNKPSSSLSNSNEIFCKNLPWNTDENKIGEYFSNYGEVVNVKILYDRVSGRSKGIAFVEFASRDQAQAVIDDSRNLMIDGRSVLVNFADQKPERRERLPFNEGDRDRSSGESQYREPREFREPREPRDSRQRHTAFVGNLSFNTNEESIRRFFSDCGNVVDVRIARNEEGRAKGFCHVDFESAEDVQLAIKKSGQELEGRAMRVDESVPRGDRGGYRGSR